MTVPELVGNVLCLDFANTVNTRPAPTRDWLAEPVDLDNWARHVGLDGRPAGPLAEVHELRDAVYQTFSPIAAGQHPARTGLDVITATYAEAVKAARLIPANTSYRLDTDRSPGDGGGAGGYVLDWGRATADRRVRWAVAESAMELLRRGPLDRVGECPSCGWLFLDISRNGRRRWCSMAMCGNRVKSARHYAAKTVEARG